MDTHSFIYQHCKQALEANPTWTIRMYIVFNDFDEDIEKELIRLLPQFVRRK